MGKIHSRIEACRVLGLPYTADEIQVKRAFKELSKRYHPDVQQNSELQAQYYDMMEAYQYLLQKEEYADADRKMERTAPRVFGTQKGENSWVSARKESQAAYQKWEKRKRMREEEKKEAFLRREEEMRSANEYETAMEQINAIRTARAIEALLAAAREEK